MDIEIISFPFNIFKIIKVMLVYQGIPGVYIQICSDINPTKVKFVKLKFGNLWEPNWVISKYMGR